MANKDVRDWIDGIKAAGELKIITGAEPKEEIGGIVDIYMRRMGNPAVMFDEIPGFPKGRARKNLHCAAAVCCAPSAAATSATNLLRIAWPKVLKFSATITNEFGPPVTLLR